MTMLSTAQPIAQPINLSRRTSSLMIVDPASLEAEAIRGLRTRIIAQHVREGRRGLVFCTPADGSGCTFTAVNLAVAMAQAGVKTVLVDADLRSGRIGSVFGSPADMPGLADFLADDQIRAEDIIESDVIADLSIIPAGPPADTAQELLSSARFAAFAGQLVREHDLAIFDTTPANSCTDAQRVATVVGHSLIIARKDRSYFNDVRALSTLLRADKSTVVGTVLTDY